MSTWPEQPTVEDEKSDPRQWMLRMYYLLKPHLPYSLRLALRRLSAWKRKRGCQDQWPINARAGIPSADWSGWPDGKRFALVLTHDVERSGGLKRIPELMNLESDLNFRSSFNFIPEGEYNLAPELRAQLSDRGFEVGVHDLKHDGKLYSSRRHFRDQAQRINAYLKDWGAVGFRSAFMLHELAWLVDLNIQYDLSTFDTDPFEAQPDGAGTIFPFWVPSADRAGGGYIEMPYTLAQDYTLFVVLRETTIETWKRKLDWVAARGGLALVNVHPDYMNFDGGKLAANEYPARYYQEFLEYVKAKHSGECWAALPRDAAAHCARALGKS